MGAGEKEQRQRELAALPEDWSSSPSTQMTELTNTSNSGSKGDPILVLWSFSSLLHTLHSCAYTKKIKLGMVVCTVNYRTQEAEAGGLLSSRPAWSME